MEPNRESRNDHTLYGQLIYNKKARIYNGEKTVTSISATGKTRQLHAKESHWTTL